jgi:hypothetical protein
MARTTSSPKNSSFTFLVEADLRSTFVKVAQSQDQTAAQVLRALMRDYISRQAQPDLPFPASSKRKASK